MKKVNPSTRSAEPIHTNYPCEACRRQAATCHITVQVTVVSGKSRRQTRAQFWLCENCEKKNRILLTQDALQRVRVAQAMTPTPSWWTEDLAAHPVGADGIRPERSFPCPAIEISPQPA